MNSGERAGLVARRQFGVISRQQALRSGVTPDALRHRLRPGGPWQRLLPAVYLTTTGSPEPDQFLVAALLHAGRGALITGAAALAEYQIKVRPRGLVDVLVPPDRQPASTGFVAIRRTARLPGRYGTRGPVRFVLPARAVADAVLSLSRPAPGATAAAGPAQAKTMADARATVASAVQQRWCTVDQLAAELRAGPHRDSALLRAALREVAEGIRSPAEADLRLLLRRHRLPPAWFNPRLYVGGRLLAVPDAWWPEAALAVEVDSREWHLLPEHWEQTMRRSTRLTAAGIRVLHFSPRQIRDEPDWVISEIRDALRRGRAIPELVTRPAA